MGGMLSWATILYGAAVSAVPAVVLALLAGQRRARVLFGVALGTAAGPIAWNTILRITRADQFFVDAPVPLFPISWQDTGSGVFAVAALTLILGLAAAPTGTARHTALLALLGGVSALVVDVYLY
jgi:hypothetical protein